MNTAEAPPAGRASPQPLHERWPQPDRGNLVRTLQDKLARLQQREGADAVETLLPWLDWLHGEDPISAMAVAERLDQALARAGSARAVGQWILTGQRLHPSDRTLQRRYYRLEDPRSIEALHAEAEAADLHDEAPALVHLLESLSERGMTVQPRVQTALNGPALRPVITPSHLLLPEGYTSLDGADRSALYRAAVAHAVAHLRFSPRAQSFRTLKPLAVAVVSAIEDARVEQRLAAELPGVRRWFRAHLPALPAAADLGFTAFMARLTRALADDALADDIYWVDKARTLFRQQREQAGLDDEAGFRRVAGILANDLGQMRVRFNAQQYVVPAAYRDDNSYLWDFGEPKQPPQADQPLMVQAAQIERQRSEWEDANAAAPEPAGAAELGRYTYSEWDHRIDHLRDAWCTVVERPVPAARAQPWARPAGSDALKLPPSPSRFLSRRHRLRRQWEGNDLDLNAAIEVLVDRRLQAAPDARLFMRPGHERRSLSLLVLLDLSESANDRVPGTMRSILDIEKQAASMLVRSFRQNQAGGDEIAVHGFASNTRTEVNYWRLLDFDAPRDDASLAPLAAAQASLSTRLGAAIRHASALLRSRQADRPALLVVTDGAPSDVDIADPRYLVEDAAAAVTQARRAGVECACVAVDPAADAYVRTMFGSRHCRIVDEPSTLPAHLSGVYQRVFSR